MPTQNPTSIRAEAGKPFTIELESNPSTGYEWWPAFSEEQVRLVRRERSHVEEEAGTSRPKLGAGGVERFVFEALTQGECSIRMDLKRAWESAQIEQRTFRVVVRR